MWSLNLNGHKLSWPTGSWLGIDGPSGCGKTRLLRQIALGKSGEFKIEGQNILALSPRQRGIGWAAQGAPLWPQQRVEQQLRALADLHNCGDWMQLSADLGVLPLLDKPTSALSGGERQRVALLAALFSAKSLLLLDEPVSALDREAAGEVLGSVRRAARQRQLSAIVVSHHWRDLAAHCDYCYHWDSQTLTDIELAHRHFNQRHPSQAAALWPAEITSDGGVYTANRRLEAGPLPTNTARISIDAHEVSLATLKPGPSSIANTLDVNIAAIDTVANNSALVTLKWGERELYSLITTNSVVELGLQTGQRVFAQFKAHAVKTPQQWL